jgi:hypothetical protein
MTSRGSALQARIAELTTPEHIIHGQKALRHSATLCHLARCGWRSRRDTAGLHWAGFELASSVAAASP